MAGIRRHAFGVASAALGLAWLGSQPAAAWPERPVQIIVPFPAGGVIDVLARPLAERLSEAFGQSFLVVPRDGAAGVIGTAAIANSRPDGHTLGFNAAGPLVVQPHLVKDITYRLEQFEPICQTFTVPFALAVVPESRFRSLKDVLDAARAQPGRVTYGTPGVGTIQHLATARLARLAGIDLLNVPYRGDPAAVVAMKSGELDIGALNAGFASGQGLRLLTVFADQRLPNLPDVPIAAEAGYPVAIYTYGGLFAPRGVARDIVQRLETACEQALRSERYERAVRAGQQVTLYRSAAAFRDKLAADFVLMRDIAVDAGLAPK